MLYIIGIIILAVYLASPLIGKIILLLANTYIPDPIPLVDEFIMWVGLLAYIAQLLRTIEFIAEHKIILFLLLILIIGLVGCGVLILIGN